MSATHFTRRDACPACESDTARTIYSRPYLDSPLKEYLVSFYSAQGKIELEYLEGGTYTLAECASCGLIYQREIPDDFLMKKLYDEWIDPAVDRAAHERGEYREYTVGFVEEILMLTSHFRSLARQLRVCDFGMGWGYWCRAAEAFGCDVSGMELSMERTVHAASHGIRVLDWNEAPGSELDFINSEQVFEHLAQPLETLRHLSRALRDGGIMKISVPNGRGVKRRLKDVNWSTGERRHGTLNPVSPLEHINCFSRRSVIAMAAKAGLSHVRIPMSMLHVPLEWKHPKESIRTLVRPLYRNLYWGGTYLFFRKPGLDWFDGPKKSRER